MLPFCLHQMRSCQPSEVETELKFGSFGHAELYNKVNCIWKRIRGEKTWGAYIHMFVGHGFLHLALICAYVRYLLRHLAIWSNGILVKKKWSSGYIGLALK